jgi:hypothetical protein
MVAIATLMIFSFIAGAHLEIHRQDTAWAVFCHCLQRKSPTIGLQDSDFVRCNNEAVEFERDVE